MSAKLVNLRIDLAFVSKLSHGIKCFLFASGSQAFLQVSLPARCCFCVEQLRLQGMYLSLRRLLNKGYQKVLLLLR